MTKAEVSMMCENLLDQMRGKKGKEGWKEGEEGGREGGRKEGREGEVV